MKKLFLMSFLMAILLLACATPSQSKQTSAAPTPQLDAPRYTPDEIVDLVKTKLTEVATNPAMVMWVQRAKGNATYTGKGVWSVSLTLTIPLTEGRDGIFTFREVTQTLVAANEAAARIMGFLKNSPDPPYAPKEPCFKGGTTEPC